LSLAENGEMTISAIDIKNVGKIIKNVKKRKKTVTKIKNVKKTLNKKRYRRFSEREYECALPTHGKASVKSHYAKPPWNKINSNNTGINFETQVHIFLKFNVWPCFLLDDTAWNS
jgi:hypothetical protein